MTLASLVPVVLLESPEKRYIALSTSGLVGGGLREWITPHVHVYIGTAQLPGGVQLNLATLHR